VRQFGQQILPSGFRLLRYSGTARPATARRFHYPSNTVEARVDRPGAGHLEQRARHLDRLFRPHLFADRSPLHWANPPGGTAGRDSKPVFGVDARTVPGSGCRS